MTRQNFPMATLASVALAALLAPGVQAQEKADAWPLVFTSGQEQVQIFKPQPESYDGTSFTARAAVALQRPQDDSPVFGALWGSGVLAVDRAERVGTITSFKVTDVRFPGITDEAERTRIMGMLSDGITRNAQPVAIDWLVAALEQEQQTASSYNNAPPTILYREQPGILLYIDGDPIMEPVKSADQAADPVYAANGVQLQRVVNTPFFLVQPKGGPFWLYGSGLWYTAPAVKGPWKNEKKAPANIEKLAAQVDSSYGAERPEGVVPEVVYTEKPAVLLDLNGAPKMEPYNNSSLMYVTNTDQDLFLEIPTQEYYLLASGRWYATKDLKNGPWRYVAPDALPAGFAEVPEGSAKDGILAHVAGTDAAREAVRDASIPQTAQVDRRTAAATVTYDGSPQFQQIAGTQVYSALNASTVVLRIRNRYYVVDNAVWFEGDTPDGPWAVSTAVPAEVNSIPPSDPNYRVRYVYIYDYNPDVVFIGYTPGYLGSYVQAGTVVYGTGYYYDPWRSAYWYPRPYTWGFNMTYNPWYGWGFGATWGYNWFYPSWVNYGYYRPYSYGWWGPYGYCPPVATWYGHGHYWHDHYVPGGRSGYYGHRPSLAQRTGTAGRATMADPARRSTDLYSNHRKPGVTPSVANARPVNRSNNTANRTVNDAASRPIQGDHFTDRAGNVYRTDQGRTEEMREGQWKPVDKVRPPATQREDNGRINRGLAEQEQQRTPPQPSAPERGRQPAMNQQADPGTIQRERTRGDQRVNDYRGYEQDRQAVPRQPAPQRVAPPAPRQSAPPMRSTPSAPNRGGTPGGGGGGVRRPR